MDNMDNLKIKVNENCNLIVDASKIVVKNGSENKIEITGVVLHNKSYNKEYPLKELKKVLLNRLKEEIDKEIENYIEKNINNTEIFNSKSDKWHMGKFTNPCCYNYIGANINKTDLYYDINLSKVHDGVILLDDGSTNHNYIEYNYITDILTAYSDYYRKEKQNLIYLVYEGNSILKHLMQQQLIKGTACKEHVFINTYNTFVVDKSSLKLEIDGKTIPVKEVSFGRVFDADKESNLWLKEYPKVRKFKIKYGKKVVNVDLDKLEMTGV